MISIRATDFVRCMEVVRLSEGQLWEVPLYSHIAYNYVYNNQVVLKLQLAGQSDFEPRHFYAHINYVTSF